MAKGQILETLKERDLSITEDEYNRIIASEDGVSV